MLASETTFPEDFFVRLLEVLPVGVGVFDPIRDANGAIEDFSWVAANRQAARAVQSSATDLLGTRMLARYPILRGTDTFDNCLAVMQTGEARRFEQVLAVEQGGGRDRWYELHALRLGRYLTVTFEDITQRKSRQEQIYTMAFRDVLTGLYNRRYFLARAPSLIALARRHRWPVAMLYFDLNGFKGVNDSHGHAIGDRLLQAVAWRMKDVCRQEAILFRSGGDEFGLFMVDADEPASRVVADRMAERFNRPFTIAKATHRIGASIGVAVLPSEVATVGALLEHADRAMYDAKTKKEEILSPITVWRPEGDVGGGEPR